LREQHTSTCTGLAPTFPPRHAHQDWLLSRRTASSWRIDRLLLAASSDAHVHSDLNFAVAQVHAASAAHRELHLIPERGLFLRGILSAPDKSDRILKIFILPSAGFT
jgi:hypothetical protein